MSFAGIRVLALESRRAAEMAELIRRQGGEPFVAPSMREAPLEDNAQAFAAAERLFRSEFDMVIFLTGVGVRALHKLLATRYPPERFPAALRELIVVARGPKPVAALRELEVEASIKVPEPNTWREIVQAVRGRPERRIAVQEYGRSNPELIQTLERMGAAVTTIRVYQWQLPEDTGPLRAAVRDLAASTFGVVMFTTPFQIVHLFRIAGEERLAEPVRIALERTVIASIGPATTEMLASYDLTPDIEPSHPKMGFLVKETGERAESLLAGKRSR
jgi:uroporphyrinogen-III synthase